MNVGIAFPADECPVTRIDFFPTTPMTKVGTTAVKSTVDVIEPLAFGTLAPTDLRVRPVLCAITPLKRLSASVTPRGISPSVSMFAAVLKALDDFATEPTAAASAAA